MRNGSAMVRMARWSATHPWSAIGLWLAFVALSLSLGMAVGTKKISDEESGVGESGRAGRIAAAGSFPAPPEESVLITAAQGTRLDGRESRAAAADVAERMKALPEVESVARPVLSPDGTAVLVPVAMRGDAETADRRAGPLLEQSAAVEKAHPGLRVEQVGTGSTAKGLGETLGADFQRAEFISLPLTLVIMLVVFGAVIAAGVPVALALSSVAAAIGLSSLVSHVMPATSAISNVILLMGMAVGVDYSLFYLKREREERRRGRADAIEIAARTSGHTVVVSGATVVVAMAGLYLAGESTFSSLATGSIIVVAVAVLASLTVLPALLAKLAPFVDRPRIPLLWRMTTRSGESRLWPALLRPALRHPALTLAVSVGALLLVALPALDMRLDRRVHLVDIATPFSPKSDGALRSLDTLRAWLPQAVAGVPGAEYGVGGKVAQGVDFTDHLQRRLPWVVGFVLLLTLAMMGVIFRSVAIAVSATALNLLSAAAAFGVLVAVFSIFGTLSMVEFKQLGVGLAAAILIDAVVIRIFVLPALMALLGSANWWPGGLSRRDRRPLPRAQDLNVPTGSYM